jgi:hypothetical protein
MSTPVPLAVIPTHGTLGFSWLQIPLKKQLLLEENQSTFDSTKAHTIDL